MPDSDTDDFSEPTQAYHPLALKQEHWPEADRVAWDALFVAGDIFDGSGPCARWSEGSRSMRARSYGYWLGFLARSGRLETRRDVTERATPSTIMAFVEGERARCSVKTTSMRLLDLYVLLRSMNQDRDWTWLARIVRRLQAQCSHGELKPQAGVTASCISRWAFNQMQAAEDREDVSDKQRALLFRDGLMLGLLIARPLRARTFIAIEIDRHLIQQTDGFVLRFAPEDMKDRKAHDMPVPIDLSEPMRRYLSHYRPLLLQGAVTSRLWVSVRGGALSIRGFSTHLADVTLREFGEALRPHAFRHIVATTIALTDPEHVNITASILGHSTLEMSQKHYNRARRVEAIAAHQDLVQSIRREARQRARRSRNATIASTDRVGQTDT